jgi:hypothetical protein
MGAVKTQKKKTVKKSAPPVEERVVIIEAPVAKAIGGNIKLGSAGKIPDGRAKSGRVWKTKQTYRSSSQTRHGCLSHMSKTFEQKEAERQEKIQMLALQKEMIDLKKEKKTLDRIAKEDKAKLRMANEYKNSSFQEIRPEKLKSMSKKHLRMVRKTAVNQNGSLELVPAFNGNGASTKISKTNRRGK